MSGKSSIRRPLQHNDLITKLGKPVEGGNDRKSAQPFDTMRDVLVFAAAVGLSRGSRVSFSQKAGDDITLETMRGNLNFKLICEVIQVLISDGGANCLAHEHDDDAFIAFEEYACGGLNLLEEALAVIPKPHGPREFRSLITNFVVDDLTSGKIQIPSQGAQTL